MLTSHCLVDFWADQFKNALYYFLFWTLGTLRLPQFPFPAPSHPLSKTSKNPFPLLTFLPASLLCRFIRLIGFFGRFLLFLRSCASTKVLEKVTPKSTLSEQPDHWGGSILYLKKAKVVRDKLNSNLWMKCHFVSWKAKRERICGGCMGPQGGKINRWGEDWGRPDWYHWCHSGYHPIQFVHGWWRPSSQQMLS